VARKVNITELKAMARGRWLEIFATIAGVELDPSQQRRHGPCPKCGGTDRFRIIDADAGALFCNACFFSRNGDGIAALGWLLGKSFKETLAILCKYLGAKPTHKKGGKPTKPKTFATTRGVASYYTEALARDHGPGARLVKTWQYDTFHVLRFDLPTPAGEKQRKEYRPVHQVPMGLDGGLGWQAGYPTGPRPLYRRKELEAAPPDLITIHGGEKAADAAADLGMIATTNAGGEKAMEQTDWSPVLRFDTIALVVDNDAAGDAFGQIMAAKLRRVKPGADVRIVKLPDLPPKGDIVEWIAAGGTREKFLGIVAATPVAIPVELDAEEDDADPHRLARVFLEEHCPYEKIVFWRGGYLSWDTFYRSLDAKDLQADVTKAIKAEFDRINVEQQLKAATRAKGGNQENEEPTKTRKVTTQLVNHVMQALRSLVKLSSYTEQQTWIDGSDRPNCVVFQNCILDLDAFLAPRDDWNLLHTPNWFSPIHLSYAIDLTCKECQTPKWDKFIGRVMEGDPIGVKTLQEWAGYCLTHDAAFQKFMLLEGEGNNGKSVFCAALTAMLGRQNVSTVPLEKFGDKNSLSTTIGKLANIATECTEMDDAAEGILKSFTSGDLMQFEEKYKQPFSAFPTARFLMSANNRPRFKDGSGALWRRMLIVKFTQTISDAERVYGMDNPRWWEKSGELPGIFWWAVLGLHRLRDQGHFTESAKSKMAVEEYREETNPARAFLVEHCEISEGEIAYCSEGAMAYCSEVAMTYCSELYTEYSKWCRRMGYHPLGEMRFGKEVKRVFPATERRRVTTRGERPYYYSGLTFSPSSLDDGNLSF